MPNDAIRYSRYRFPPVIISHAVWLYYRFSLSFREVEDLLAHRGLRIGAGRSILTTGRATL